MNNAIVSNNSNVPALQTLSAIVQELDVRYMEADVRDKLAMKDELDEAFLAFSRARLRLLQNRVLCDSACMQQMQHLQAEITAAADNQALIQGIVRLIGFLVRL
jgi:hypothetical protein